MVNTDIPPLLMSGIRYTNRNTILTDFSIMIMSQTQINFIHFI